MFNSKIVSQQVVDWIRDYFAANASPDTKAIVGISGGKDSSVVAALCSLALGVDRVVGVLMPRGNQFDIDVSYDLCRTIGIKSIEVNIANAVKALYGDIIKTGLELNDVAKFNTPARMRMTTLYAISAILGGRVANTSNFSEAYVGYATKFGDSAGDFSPLSDFTVTEVKAIGRELGLPSRFVDKTPIDGLTDKTDEENLGFTYDALDKYIREGVCEDADVLERIKKLHKQNLHKMQALPKFEYRTNH